MFINPPDGAVDRISRKPFPPMEEPGIHDFSVAHFSELFFVSLDLGMER